MGRYRLRNLEPRDLPSLRQIAAAQNRRDSTSYPVPRLFQMDPAQPGYGLLLPNVPLALVTERDGRVRQVSVFLRTIEEMSFGGGLEDMKFSAAHIPMACDLLRRKGYEEMHTFVPHLRVSEAHAKLLEDYGLTRLDNRFATFFKEL